MLERGNPLPHVLIIRDNRMHVWANRRLKGLSQAPAGKKMEKIPQGQRGEGLNVMLSMLEVFFEVVMTLDKDRHES